jgi:L-fuconolactonase
MRIDTHQHFWKYNRKEYAWISEEMNPLKSNFLPENLLPELNKLNFDGTIAVQARQSLKETQWLLELADRYDFIKGVVGWVDLCSPQADRQLKTFMKNPKFAGVRHVLQNEPDDRFMMRESFLQGIGMLQDMGLIYELLVLPKQLPVAVELVQKFPEQTFVLDHIAKPLIRDTILSPWKEYIYTLAEQPNVYCKLSGMVTEASWQNWKKADFVPYLTIVFDAFGPGRLMIGSDWPVCTLAGSYSEIMQIVIEYIADMNPVMQELILGKNAANIYNLKGI